jgi:ubiquinone/menaquinone biosynthesis C-methylase UbiE
MVGILFAITLVASPYIITAQKQQSALEPENANEARLNRLQPPEQVMDAIGVKPGMVVAEIGAGRGRYVVQLATRVGEQGKVYAEDIHGASLQHCLERCRRCGLENVETIIGDETDPKLPKEALDLIFVISAYHHFSDPIALMRNARPALKPDGILAIVEWLPKDGRLTGSSSPQQIEAQMKAAGYMLVKTDPCLESNRLMIYLFRPGSDQSL